VASGRLHHSLKDHSTFHGMKPLSCTNVDAFNLKKIRIEKTFLLPRLIEMNPGVK
jgi:hypothetical protein